MGALSGTHALITGGGTGIGAAIARALAGEGAAISIAGRRKAPLDEMVANLPKATAIVADITKAEDCTTMVAAARATFGSIDIVIANAGAASSAQASKITPALWQETLGVNLTGAFFTAQAALADVTRKSDTPRRIVFVASTAGLRGYPYVAAYVAAKHGVVGLARALSVELASTGVTVNAICPGFVDTPLLAAAADKIAAKTGRSIDDARRELAKDNAGGRLITPEEVAQTVLRLCLPQSASINGEAIEIMGAAA
jgi:NAD(P)-dependent dehydrogenase (short-subunit alcohol dehydrogenase family)